MLRIFRVGVVLLGTACGVAAAPAVQTEIAVELDPETHRLVGTETLRWTNTTGASTSELWLHLYLNAFSGPNTTLMRELRASGHFVTIDDPTFWGWIRVTAMESEDGTDLLPNMTFERPDDGNPDDFTVARISLDRVIEPGAAIGVTIEFEAQLPRLWMRTGWTGDFHMVGQWFPKPGIFEPAGHGGRDAAGWNCHQFHAASEFFAEFGRYRVQVTVPADWVVAGTGVVLEEHQTNDANDDKRVTTFVADRVHDFAWCAAPSDLMMVVEEAFEPGRDVPMVWLESAREILGLSAADLELPPVHLRLLVPRTQSGLVDRMVHSARLAVAWFGLHYGPYPYPQLTVISPPPTAGGAAGMEYPTLITTGASKLMEYPPLAWTGLIETVTVHEFGHQYFQGQLASNEAEEAWLDEGLTSYAEAECINAVVEDRLAPGLRLGDGWLRSRLGWAFSERLLAVDRDAWSFRNREEYALASYTKPALVLKTLEGLLGSERMARAMRAYTQRWRFAHPTGADFRRTINEESGEDMEWFFTQALDDEAIVDWAVGDIVQHRTAGDGGLQWDGERWTGVSQAGAGADGAAVWEITATVVREGSFTGPVEVLFYFADGREQRRSWDGRARWVRYEFSHDARLRGMVVDPEQVWALEGDRSDNYWKDHPSRFSTGQSGWWLPAAIRLITAGIQPWS